MGVVTAIGGDRNGVRVDNAGCRFGTSVILSTCEYISAELNLVCPRWMSASDSRISLFFRDFLHRRTKSKSIASTINRIPATTPPAIAAVWSTGLDDADDPGTAVGVAPVDEGF